MKIHLVPLFHYDVAYRWRFEEYLERSIRNLDEALRLLETEEEYTYHVEQVILLKEYWERRPENREKLRRMFKDGRIECSGIYVMPEINMISGESILRQFEYGKRWMEKNLNYRGSKVFYLADAWGATRTIPQLLMKLGFEGFFFTRGMNRRLNKTDFIWLGLDGTKIFAHWIAMGGVDFTGERKMEEMREFGVDPLEENLRRVEKVVKELRGVEPENIANILILQGGDFTEPRIIAIRVVREFNRRGKDRMFFSSLEEFLHSLKKEDSTKIPIYKGELLPLFHGTYSSRAEIKQWNRRLENLAFLVERVLSILRFKGITWDYFEDLDYAWERIIRNQSHDTISGTIVDEAYEDAIEWYREAEETLTRLLERALAKIVPEGEELRLLLLNQLPYRRRDYIEFSITIPSFNLAPILLGENGEEIPLQAEMKRVGELEGREPYEARVLAYVDVPPLGWKSLRMKFVKNRKEEEVTGKIETGVSEIKIETPFYKVVLDRRSGVVKRLWHKRMERELVDSKRPYFGELVLYEDYGDLWCIDRPIHHPTSQYSEVLIDKPYFQGEPGSETQRSHMSSHRNRIRIRENGRLRMCIEIEGRLAFWNKGPFFVHRLYLYRDTDYIDFETRIVGNGRRYRVKVQFPTVLRDGRRKDEVPFGWMKRGEGEYPILNYMTYESKDGDWGYCLLNYGIPAGSVVDGVLMLTLMRSAHIGENKGEAEGGFEEGRELTFHYRLKPFSGFFEPWREGEIFTNRVLVKPYIGGEVPEESYVECKGCVLTAMKPSTDGVVLRMYNPKERRNRCSIRIRGASEVYETGLCGGEPKRRMRSINGEIEIKMGRFEIKEFRVNVSGNT